LLFVDDESNILSSLRRLFKPLGYKLFFANSGAAGLEILEQQSIDLIVSDMRMPEMDGADFLGRAARKWPDTIRLLLTGHSDMATTIKAINSGQIYYYISKPWDEGHIKVVIRQALEHKFLQNERSRLLELTQKQNEELAELNTGLENKVLQRTEELRQTMDKLKDAHNALQNNYDTTIRVFSSFIELSENAIAGHSHRVAEMADGLATRMGINDDYKKTIIHAALLHDIGKLGLPDSLINTPFKSLKPRDQKKVLEHAVIGQTILMALGPLQQASQLIRGHHERFDGHGYPDKLVGNEIPMGARILSVINDYDALISGTLETSVYSDSRAREYLEENKGSRYDPAVVDAFIDLLSEITDIDDTTMTAMSTNDLNQGMEVARDILTRNGLLLLPKGFVLSQKTIEQLRYLEKKYATTFTIFIHKS